FLIVCLSSLGLPGLNGFVGEFLILVGAFQVDKWLAAVATTGIVFAAVYLLWMYQRVALGEIRHEANRRLRDLTPREWAVLVPVLVLIVWIGVYPRRSRPRRRPPCRRSSPRSRAKRASPRARSRRSRGSRSNDPGAADRPRRAAARADRVRRRRARAAARPAAAAHEGPPGRRGAGRHRAGAPRLGVAVGGGHRRPCVPRHGAARPLCALLPFRDLLRGRPRRAALHRLPATQRRGVGRVLRAAALLDDRHDAAGLGR